MMRLNTAPCEGYAHVILTPGPYPHFYILAYRDELMYEELFLDEPLHLNEGHPVYILIDTSAMYNRLPENFMQGIVRSFIINPNIAAMAVYIPSIPLRVVAHMVVNALRLHKKVSIFQTYHDAYAHLIARMQTPFSPQEGTNILT